MQFQYKFNKNSKISVALSPELNRTWIKKIVAWHVHYTSLWTRDKDASFILFVYHINQWKQLLLTGTTAAKSFSILAFWLTVSWYTELWRIIVNSYSLQKIYSNTKKILINIFFKQQQQML